MELQVWMAYFVASWAIALSPGSGAVLSMTHGLAYGVQKTSATIAGLQLGLAVILLVAGVGVGAGLAGVSGLGWGLTAGVSAGCGVGAGAVSSTLGAAAIIASNSDVLIKDTFATGMAGGSLVHVSQPPKSAQSTSPRCPRPEMRRPLFMPGPSCCRRSWARRGRSQARCC